MCTQDTFFSTTKAKRILEEHGVLNTKEFPISTRMVAELFDFAYSDRIGKYWTKKADFEMLIREIGSSGWQMNHGFSARNSVRQPTMYFA